MKFEGTISIRRVGKRKVTPKTSRPVHPTHLKAIGACYRDASDGRLWEVQDYAKLARLAQVIRARITQIMNLNLLSPELQERLWFLQPVDGGQASVTLKTQGFV